MSRLSHYVLDADQATAGANEEPVTTKAVPVRHWGQWIGAAILIYLVAALLVSLWNNPAVDRQAVGEYLFSPTVLRGLLVTIELTVVAMVIGVAGGVVLAIMRLSHNPVLQSVSWAYIWLFRGTPLLVQIILLGYLAALYPRLTLGLPFTDVEFLSGDTNVLMTAFAASVLALGLNEAAYAAELVRAGIMSVDAGQTEAAQSLGMGFGVTMRKVVLPQAMRVIIPPMGNETITMLKSTALVSVIGGGDLFTLIQQIYSQNFKVIPLLAVASLWYLFLVSVFSIGQHYVENHYNQGVAKVGGGRGARRGYLERLLGFGRAEQSRAA
jgi:polar amino acid transport system permease protein